MTQDMTSRSLIGSALPTDREAQVGGGQGLSEPTQEFLDALLAALAQMAALSPRRQADVAVAMRRAGLAGSRAMVLDALGELRGAGCVDQVLHLSDDGILVSVTMRGIERLAATSHRYAVAGMMAPRVA